MLKTLYLGKLSGIQIYIHWTFWLLVLYLFLRDLGLGVERAFASVIFVFMIFACVFLHELGHAFSGRWFNVKTQDITLYPIGGVARMQLVNLTPFAELVIAACGPLVNLVIATFIAVSMFTQMAWAPPDDIGKLAFWEQLFIVNVALFCFNLLPVYPMDGGRIFRAILSFFVKREVAVEWSARTGQVLAALLALYGLITFQFSILIIFGIMFLVCSAELFQAKLKRSGIPPGSPWPPSSSGTPFGASPPFEQASRTDANGDVVDAVEVREIR